MTITIDPIIGQWGTFQLGWHAVASFVAIIVAVAVAVYFAKKVVCELRKSIPLAPGNPGGHHRSQNFSCGGSFKLVYANPLQILAIQEAA